MKNSTLLFRSLFSIALITGGAHLVTYANQNKEKFNPTKENTILDTISPIDITNIPSQDNLVNSEIDYIIGKWKVKFDNSDFKGAIVYDLKKENGVFNAYILEYQDEKGHSQKTESVKTLIIKSFDGSVGKGQYLITYQGQEYDVDCDIDLLDTSTFKLSYDYYGYSAVVTWKKQ